MKTKIFLVYQGIKSILKDYQDCRFNLDEASTQVAETFGWIYGGSFDSVTATGVSGRLLPRGEVFQFVRFLESREILKKNI